MSLHVHLFTLFLLLAAASGLGFFWAKHTEINALLLETRTNAMHQYLVKDENIYRLNRYKGTLQLCNAADKNADGVYEKVTCSKAVK
ncbi:MAG: hypothetical protein VX730_09020 [Pseudomonadota bacterium]|nr:hypothetical protein [Pseudomonadota bacterium]